MTYSLETVFEVWNDKTGERIEIGEDRDSLGLTEIRSRMDDGQIGARIVLTNEQVPLVIEALQRHQECKKSR